MSWQVTFLTLFPQAFPGLLDISVLGRARTQGIWSLDIVDLVQFGHGKHKNVDDTPAGGGPGMVMRVDVLAAALDSVAREGRTVIYPSPRGKPFTQARAKALADGPGTIFLCGRFEGIDERIIDARGLEEVSLGDFVLAGGEVAAMAMTEACLRLLPGVLNAPSSLSEESFTDGLLEYPQYTRPRVFESLPVPAMLLSGNHQEITAWRRQQALMITRARRPDLLLSSGENSVVDDKNEGKEQ